MFWIPATINQTKQRTTKLIFLLLANLHFNVAEPKGKFLLDETRGAGEPTVDACEHIKEGKFPQTFHLILRCRWLGGCWICITTRKRLFHRPSRKQSQDQTKSSKGAFWWNCPLTRRGGNQPTALIDWTTVNLYVWPILMRPHCNQPASSQQSRTPVLAWKRGMIPIME